MTEMLPVAVAIKHLQGRDGTANVCSPDTAVQSGTDHYEMYPEECGSQYYNKMEDVIEDLKRSLVLTRREIL